MIVPKIFIIRGKVTDLVNLGKIKKNLVRKISANDEKSFDFLHLFNY